ncbi:hypothetical protein FXO38_11335 [Capsicum annuum]|nr:hypothetical protein FXO38_11335 [Capsicum annuum]
MDNGTTITLLIKQPLQVPTTTTYVELKNEAAPDKTSSAGVVTAGGETLAGGEAAATAEAASGEASSAGVVAADSDHENLFIEDDEFKNDVHEEDINLRAKRRKYQRQKRRERKSNDPKEVSIGEVGLDLGFEETEIADKSLKGKVDGDEPVYCSSDKYSVDFDLEDGLRKIDSRKVMYDDSAKQVVWQLGMVFEDVNEFRDVVTKYALQRGVKLEKYINESKKGLRATLIEFLPEVEYRICARHILANWGKNREDSVESSILNAGPSDVPTITRRRGRSFEHAATAARGRGKGVGHVSAAAVAARGRERPRKAPLGDIAVARKTLLREWFENPTSYAPPNPPNSLIYAPLNPSASPVHNPPNPHASTGKRPKDSRNGCFDC